jgi:5-methyltetrahydrofolate--homocysteine methyltransferase
MHELLQSLPSGPLVTDGAWGTQLQLAGLGPGQCPEEWNLSRPDRVERVARSYADAGSQVILTNTLGANRLQLCHQGLGDRVPEINRAAAQISLRAAADRALVFASIGPTGKLAALGEISEAELTDVFTQQSQALAEAGANALLLESFTDLDEIRPAITAAKATGLLVVASMVFDSGPAHDRTMMGKTPEEVAKALTAAGADVVGANCGRGIDGYVSVCQRMREVTDLPLWIKPNAGIPELVDGRTVYRTSPEQFAARVLDLVRAGARFVGGCCGTSPEFVTAINQALGR